MGFLEGLASQFIEKLANRVADEVILVIRKKTRMLELDAEAKGLKDELKNAQSTAEKEAVLDKVYDLINGVGRV